MDVFVYSTLVPVTQEQWDDALPPWPEMMRQVEEAQQAFKALPMEEQKRILAEREAAYESERCSECGCHPDEHGSY